MRGGGGGYLELVDELDLVANARSTGRYLREQLTSALSDHPRVGEVRGKGLLAAVEFSQDRSTGALFDPILKISPRIVAAMLERGVIARAMPQGDIIGLAPPLCITPEKVDIVIETLSVAIEEVLATA